jgi:hypothetical protein
MLSKSRAREEQEYTFAKATVYSHSPPTCTPTPLFMLLNPALGLHPIFYLNPLTFAPTRSLHSLPPR